ncbi:MAG: HlyC/CorC family transporter [Candidatus Omnitrophica bacterium]|nr:HlyC/CorC family transporter [Candidatus Omnitrophota bacterium]
MISLIILIIGVLVISGICSMTEAAILSIPFVKVRVLSEEKRKGSKALLYIKKNIHSAIATIVVLNNAVNIIGAIYVGQRVSYIFGSHWLGMASAVLTFAIIIFSEVIPKTIGEHYKIRISLISAKPLQITIWIFKPFIWIMIFITTPFRKRLKFPKVTEQEIKIMLRLGRDGGTIETDEETLCNRVFKLNDLRAAAMMKPIENIYALPMVKRLSEIKEDVINFPYSRIPVYKKNVSNIVGICQQRILLREIARDNYDARLGDFMSSPIFVNEDEKADSLLEKFQTYHQHAFIVRNKKKQNIGILTMEDVLEELFGEIYDEKDSHTAAKK